MYVDRPSCIELHVRETVQIDRLQPMGVNEYVAERHGALLAPGVTQVQLEQGIYHFRTLDDTQLRVLAGGVRVDSPSEEKDTPVGKIPIGLGQGLCGHVPALRVVDAPAGAS
jgi:hypothetical protein